MNVSCQGAASPPRQRAFPFFLEVHDKLTKSWHPPYSACLGMSTSSTFTSVDRAEEKAYEKAKLLSCMDESGSDPAAFKELCSLYRPSPMSHKGNSAGHRQVNGQSSGAREPLMVKHD